MADEKGLSPRTIAALAFVVLAAAGAVYMNWGRGDRAGHAPVDLACRACNHTFQMSAEEVAAVRGNAGDPHKKMVCPKCGKETGEEQMGCGQCGKLFLPKANPREAGALRCPHCGFDPKEGVGEQPGTAAPPVAPDSLARPRQ